MRAPGSAQRRARVGIDAGVLQHEPRLIVEVRATRFDGWMPMEFSPSQSFVEGAVALSDGTLPEALRSDTSAHPMGDPVIVVGGGPTGLRVAQEVARRGRPVVLFNAERWRPYNRVKLTPFLAGEVQIGRVYQPNIVARGAPVTQYNNHTIVAIDREARAVENQFGRRWRYSKLVLCLGSRAHIPPIPGRELSGVFRFRSFDDVEGLVARTMRSRRTVVIGGGLLGLEAARGMALRQIDTVVVEHESHLMARQLDHAGGLLLEAEILNTGVDIRTGCSVKSIDGDGRVEQVSLSSGEILACDTVIICTGIRSNIELARDAGIAVSRGVTVNDAMQTSDPDIYAAGECAEHDGNIYGLVAPGLEQAAVVAAHVSGEMGNYRGSVPSTKLKVIGTDVFSMGDVEQLDQRTDVRTLAWSDPKSGLYRRLVFNRRRLVGGLGVGPWPELNRIQQSVRDRIRVSPWQRWRFARNGRLFAEGRPQSVMLWPSAATVCNCTGVSRGQLGDAINNGAGSIEELMRETSASTVCGSCRPLLQEIIGGKAVHPPVYGARLIVMGSFIAAALALATALLPAWPYSPSVELGIGLDRFWTDGFWKQVTGFTLLGLSAVVAFLSVRKRVRMRWLGDFRFWRIAHTLLGAAALAVLFIHTGFHLGENLNRWLMLTFLAVAIVGTATGVVTAREHAALTKGRSSPRALFTWLHIVAFWPLPVLLTLHIVTVYAY
jgi:nitrite reductase (NADH) large subunit